VYNVFKLLLARVTPTLGVSGGRMLLPGIAKVKQQPPEHHEGGMTVGGQETQVPVTQLGYPKP